MCQRDILDFLKRYPGKQWDAHQIALYNGLNEKNVMKLLSKLRKYNEVNYLEIECEHRIGNHRFLYSFKQEDGDISVKQVSDFRKDKKENSILVL